MNQAADLRLRIGLIVPGFSANAMDWCIPALLNLFRRLDGSDVRVLALRYPHTRHAYTVHGIPVQPLGGAEARGRSSARLWAEALATLVRQHRARPFDLLHAFWAGEAGWLTTLAGRLLRVPTIVTLAGGELVALRDIGYGGQRTLHERLQTGAALHLASAVTAGSDTMVKLARRHFGPRDGNKLRRIPLGVDVERFKPSGCDRVQRRRPGGPAAEHGRPRTVVHVASLTAVKDQATLLRAFERASRAVGDAHLHLIGAGPCLPTLRALAEELGLEGRIIFHGALPHDALPAAYRTADVFALSSRHEAQCMAALEAAACGAPVVGTSVGVVPELGRAAIAVPIGDSAALGEALVTALTDRAQHDAMACAARETAAQEYSLDVCVSRFESLYTEIADMAC